MTGEKPSSDVVDRSIPVGKPRWGSQQSAPSQLQQAKERARDDPSRTTLLNMVHDLDCVLDVFLSGEDEDWRPTAVTVGFRESRSHQAAEVATIMRRAGWRFDRPNFTLDRLTFVNPQTIPEAEP